jgi:hypothetical protein
LDPKEKALKRAGSERLAEVLLDVVNQFVTPVEDPVYDWQIVPLTRLAVIRMDGNLTWRVNVPDPVETGVWKAPARQCALAWGTRMPLSRVYDDGSDPSRVAVLVHAVQDEEGQIRAQIGAQFLFRRPANGQPGTWFRGRGSNVDPNVSTLIIGYLNSREGTDPIAESINGVDLDD